MPFPFVYMCDLLDKLEEIHVREVAYLPKDRKARTKDTLVSWFQTHRWRINAQDTDGNAVLMMLRPERQIDREYGLQPHMEQILARIFKMPTAMYERLKNWREDAHSRDDLGLRLCKVLQEMKFIPTSSTTNIISADEIDQALLRIAIFNARSSVAVQSLKETDESHPDRIEVLEELYLQLQPREAKWLTRIILKDFGPVTLPSGFPVSGNITHLPNSLPVMLNFPTDPPSPKRRTKTRIKRGVGSNKPALPTPPTSSANLPAPEKSPVAGKPAPRYRIAWNAQSSTLSATLKTIATPTPAKSSPQPTSSARPEEASHKIVSPPTSSVPFTSIPITSQRPRKALGQISSNIPSGGSRSQSQQSQSRSQEKDATTQVQVTSSRSQPSQGKMSPTPRSPVVFSKGKCLLARTIHSSPSHSPKRCQFSSSLLILSPCLQSNPQLIQSLIPHHGAHYLTSLSQLSHPSIPRRTKSGGRVKKFILVDITRPEKAVRFCQEVERAVEPLGWMTRGGRRERIPIFDWRVLESAAKVDRGVVLGYDFLEKHFQGVV